jgi:hypothetical protein
MTQSTSTPATNVAPILYEEDFELFFSEMSITEKVLFFYNFDFHYYTLNESYQEAENEATLKIINTRNFCAKGARLFKAFAF